MVREFYFVSILYWTRGGGGGGGGGGLPTEVGPVCRGVQLTMITDCQKTTYSVWGLPY